MSANGATKADLFRVISERDKKIAALQAYRAACWVWEPEEDSGFDRVNAALAVFSVVRGWLDSGRVTITDDEDPESFYECLNEAEFLGRELLKACRAESDAGLKPTQK